MIKRSSQNKTSQELLSEVAKSSSFESFLFDAWYRYRRYIAIGIMGIVLLIIGVQGVKLYYSYHVKQLQKEFLEAASNGKELEFATENAGEPLAGFIFLKEADKVYQEKQYSEAIAFYDKAATAFKGTPFQGRALMGSAFANIYSGEHEKGKMILEDLANDTKIAQAYRAQALYQLTLLAVQEKDFKQAQEYINHISGLSMGGIWTKKAMALDGIFPELGKTTSLP